MNEKNKDILQYGSAIILMLSGMVLVYLCFFLEKIEFKDYSLGYFGMTLTFGGATFGFYMWSNQRFKSQDHKINEMRNLVENSINNK